MKNPVQAQKPDRRKSPCQKEEREAERREVAKPVEELSRKAAIVPYGPVP